MEDATMGSCRKNAGHSHTTLVHWVSHPPTNSVLSLTHPPTSAVHPLISSFINQVTHHPYVHLTEPFLYPRLTRQSTKHPINFQHPSIHLVIFHPSDLHPSVYPLILPSFYPSIPSSFIPSIYPPTHLAIVFHHPSINPPSIHPFTHACFLPPSTHPSIYSFTITSIQLPPIKPFTLSSKHPPLCQLSTSIHPFIHYPSDTQLLIHPSSHLSSIHPLIFPSFLPSIHPIYLPILPSIHLSSVHHPIHPLIQLSFHPNTYPPPTKFQHPFI